MAAGFGRRSGAPPRWVKPAPGPRVTHWLNPPKATIVEVAPDINRGLPLLTGGLLALLAGVFWLEIRFAFSSGGDLSPGYATLVALGGSGRSLVIQHGEWWRLVSAVLLHGSLTHILGNSLVLAFIGYYLERLVGRAWFAAVFVVGGLGGSIASLLLNPVDLVGVGASGAIMGLLGCAFICSFHLEAHKGSGWAQFRIAWVALPALLPSSGGGPVLTDYSAHAGGALAGMALGYVIVALWPESLARPKGARAAAGVALAGVLAAAVSGACVVAGYPAHQARIVGMIPDGELPDDGREQLDKSAALVAAYPKDPRGHLLRALCLASNGNSPAAISELQTGLADPTVFNVDLHPGVQPAIRLLLAALLADRGRVDEARAVVGDSCGYPLLDRDFRELEADLKRAGVCR